MIIIDCVWHSDDTTVKESCGIDFSYEDCEFRQVTFFNINAIAPAKPENGKEYTYIYANGTLFVAPFSKTEVMKAIMGGRTCLLVEKPDC